MLYPTFGGRSRAFNYNQSNSSNTTKHLLFEFPKGPREKPHILRGSLRGGSPGQFSGKCLRKVSMGNKFSRVLRKVNLEVLREVDSPENKKFQQKLIENFYFIDCKIHENGYDDRVVDDQCCQLEFNKTFVQIIRRKAFILLAFSPSNKTIRANFNHNFRHHFIC